jgi:hypothetical protein
MMSSAKVVPLASSYLADFSMEESSRDRVPNSPSDLYDLDVTADDNQGVGTEGMKKVMYAGSYAHYTSSLESQAGIKPRFVSGNLLLAFISRIELAKTEPIQVYEAALYKIAKDYQNHFEGADLTIEHLVYIHHIHKLKLMETTLTQEQISTLNYKLDSLLTTYPTIKLEHKLYSDITALVSALSVKWGVVKLERFSYRHSAKVANVKVLEMPRLNEDVYTIEALWLAVLVNHPPLNATVDHDVLQYAKVLRRAMDNVIRAVVHLNSEADFEGTPSLEAYFATKFPKIAALKHWEAEGVGAAPPSYHQMSQSGGFLAKCLKSRHLKQNQQLKTLIEELDFSYRCFERELISFFLLADERGDVRLSH